MPFFAYCALDVMASLKYMPENECISLISGEDLCLTLLLYQILTVLSGIIFISLIIFGINKYNKSLKQKV